MWQACPVCKGDGEVNNIHGPCILKVKCTVCEGKKIISTLTGHPPVTKVQEEKPLTGVADPLKSIKFL
jgi:hypothetical protein